MLTKHDACYASNINQFLLQCFSFSSLNRLLQQIGSTFRPIIYCCSRFIGDSVWFVIAFIVSRPRQNGRHFPNDIWNGFFLFLRFQLTINSIGLENGLAPNGRQAIVWTNDSLFLWRIYASLGLSELMVFLSLSWTLFGHCQVTIQLSMFCLIFFFGSDSPRSGNYFPSK